MAHERTNTELQRTLRFLLATDELTADRTVPWERGTALVTPSLPDVWDSSYLRVERGPGLDAAALAAAADRVLGGAGVRHRAAAVTAHEDAARLGGGLAARGWREERLLVMVLRGTPRRRPGAPRVEEVDREELLPLRRAMIMLEPWGSPAAASQLLERDARVLGGSRARWFAVRAEGRPVASCAVVERDGVVEIDDVGTLPRWRGRGLSRAVVTAATAAARADGAELVFLGALSHDWPKDFYARLGFEPVGALHRFRRP
jgi:GNAT superfamily N-acetyltransferase